MKVKIGPELNELIRLGYRADTPLLIVGSHGIGKSEAAMAAAEQLKIDFRVFDLSLMEPPDLMGIPRIVDGQTVYCPPRSLPRESGRGGILMFEELNRAPKYMRAPCLQLLTARLLGDYPLPKGWLPMAAINPTNSEYHTDELDPALLSRFMKISVVADRDCWLAWADKAGVHPKVVDYAKYTPEIFDDQHKISNPRTWKYVSDVLKTHEALKIKSIASLYPAVSGLLNEVWASSFLRFYCGENELPLKHLEILEDLSMQKPIISKWKAAKRVDLLRSSWMNLRNHLQRQSNYDAVRSNSDAVGNLKAFVALLPKDMIGEVKSWFQERGYEL